MPLREQGMTPYEILLSESQERMLLVAKTGTEDEVKRIFDKWDLDAVVIGRVTDDRQFRALFDGVEVVSIPISALTKEAPVYQRPVERPKLQDELEQLDLSNIAEPSGFGCDGEAVCSDHRTSPRRNGFTANTIISCAAIQWLLLAPMLQ